jgi:dsRNA-specific ribonuclease
MGSQATQLPSHTGSGFRKARKFIKRVTSKKARRNGKERQQDAPTRRIQGWTD